MRSSLGPGFRFHPTDVELIMYYLKRKVMRKKFHSDGIRVLDVYNFDPWDLQGQAGWKRDLKCYFFCPRKRKYLIGERTNRSTKRGFWKTTGNDKPVRYNGEIVGMIKSLIFHTKNPTQRTNWVMHEYRLCDEYIKQLGLEEDVFVLCMIFEKEGRGPRNGAQYGGPYRDEDWDDDNDCDTDDELDNRGEDTNVAGALTPVHTDKGKSIVPNDFERTDGCCVGSSSRTLPSHVDQSVDHGFPPTPVPGTLFMDSQLSLSKEYGMFVDEIPSASLENEQAQDIGVDGDINCEPSIPANKEKIYDGLEDICELDDLADSDASAHGCDFLANQNIHPDDRLELADFMDVSDPFECSHGQVDHHFDGVGTTARFGIVQPPQSMPREHHQAPMNGAKRWDEYAISFPYGESSVRVKTEVNPFGWDWRTNDTLSNGLEEVSFVTVECNRNGNDTSGKKERFYTYAGTLILNYLFCVKGVSYSKSVHMFGKILEMPTACE